MHFSAAGQHQSLWCSPVLSIYREKRPNTRRVSAEQQRNGYDQVTFTFLIICVTVRLVAGKNEFFWKRFLKFYGFWVFWVLM